MADRVALRELHREISGDFNIVDDGRIDDNAVFEGNREDEEDNDKGWESDSGVKLGVEMMRSLCNVSAK